MPPKKRTKNLYKIYIALIKTQIIRLHKKETINPTPERQNKKVNTQAINNINPLKLLSLIQILSNYTIFIVLSKRKVAPKTFFTI